MLREVPCRLAHAGRPEAPQPRSVAPARARKTARRHQGSRRWGHRQEHAQGNSALERDTRWPLWTTKFANRRDRLNGQISAVFLGARPMSTRRGKLALRDPPHLDFNSSPEIAVTG